MWLANSSVGRKFVMAITGACLILFVTFHAAMNSVALLWPAAYNSICAFLGANWYALIASAGLGLLFVLHILYALWLTVQNRKARGNDRYQEFHKPVQVEWASQNMLVLGIVIIAFLAVHLIQFWARMQLAEICGTPYESCELGQVAPQSGTLFLYLAFQNWWTPVIYIIGFIALWFHMTHGFWSMFQSAGWNNSIWIPRLKCIGNWWTTIVCLLFVAQAVVFYVQAQNGCYLNCPQLQEQYMEFNAEQGIGCPVAECTEAVAVETVVLCPKQACGHQDCTSQDCTGENCDECPNAPECGGK